MGMETESITKKNVGMEKELWLLSTAVETSRDCILITDLPRTITYANKAAEEMDAAGRKFWTLSTNSLLRDKQGHPVGIVGIVTDITERKQQESLKAASTKSLTPSSLPRRGGVIPAWASVFVMAL